MLAELDFVFAKASLAKDMEAVCPKVSVDGQVRFIRARHPLIDRQTVVPLDFWIGDGFRTLVITGPNTGGKTVTLKTIGLLTLMAQSGLHIPAAYGSQIALFREVYADIGDEQSIEQSLSTFSAHMTNIVAILKTVTDRDLVLFDELGAGTDPTEGAALAQAILSHLTGKGITAIATTHYSELKAYALSTRGVENASVEFDVNTLRPTYRLSIGVPGKSNAFEISRKLGLSEEMIHDAKELLNHDAIKFEDVIANAEYHRQIAEKEQALAEEARRETVRMKNETERLYREVEEMERTADRKAREKARAIVEKARLDAEKILSDMKRLKQQASQGSMGQLVRQLDRMSDQFSDGLESARHLPEAEDREIREGDTVLVTTLNTQGTVLSLSDDSAQVQIGVMKMNCSRKDLVFVKSGQKAQKKVSVTARVDSQSRQVGLSCDLRGLSLEEALSKADQYLDEGETISATQVDFVQANNLYRSGTYDEAADGYRSIIETAPSHMGANVNLVLALLQLGEVEEALSQAFACTFLYSTEPGVILNLQVAAVANGFSSTDALSTMTEALEEAGYLNPLEYMDGSSVEQECTYNMLWDDIDLQLYGVAQGEASENDHSYYDLTVRLRELEAQDD